MFIKPTKLEHARVELLKSIKLKKNVIEVPLQKAMERISRDNHAKSVLGAHSIFSRSVCASLAL